MVESLKTLEELNEILKNEFVVIDFSAVWCGPCRMISKPFEELAKNNEKVKFYKVDVDSGKEIAAKYEISAMPTFLFFKDGELNQGLTLKGANLSKLKENLETLLN